MQKGVYKKTLFEIFDVLEFSEEEKQEALESFKKKLANDLFDSVKNALPQAEQDWIKSHAASVNPHDPKVAEIRDEIKSLYPKEEWYEKSRVSFKKILEEYVDFMSRDLNLDENKTAQLRKIVEKL